MRKLNSGELAVQLWTERDYSGIILKPLVNLVIAKIIDLDGTFIESEGPTAHLPDFFHPHIYGNVFGWIIYASRINDPYNLKVEMTNIETYGDGMRKADIDVLIDEYHKVSTKNGIKKIVSIQESFYGKS